MALSVDWNAKVVYSDTSITDVPAHHLALRNLEASEIGILYEPIHRWQSLDLGDGATFPQVDYINGYTLQFVGTGPFKIIGNLNAIINPTGAHVERKTSAAFVTTSIGGTGPSAADIADAVLDAARVSPIHANVKAGQDSIADAVWNKTLP